MSEEILRETARFHTYLAAMRQQLDNVASASRLRGTDRSGMVSVTLGSRGDFQEVYVSDDWERSLAPAALAAAVVEAAREAERAEVVESVGRLYDAFIVDRIDRMEPDDFPATPIDLISFEADDRTTPSLDHIVDSALTIAEQSDSPFNEGHFIVGESEESEGWVTVTLDPDGALTDCSVGAYWAAGRAGGSITWAINMAADDARSRSAPAIASSADSTAVSDIVSDAIKFISQIGQ